MAKLFFKVTQFGQKWMYSFGAALACVFEKTMPLNATWLLDRIFEFSNYTGTIAFFLKNAFIFGFNYCIWEMLTVQGYLLCVDVLIGGFSLSFCLEKATRYLKLLF